MKAKEPKEPQGLKLTVDGLVAAIRSNRGKDLTVMYLHHTPDHVEAHRLPCPLVELEATTGMLHGVEKDSVMAFKPQGRADFERKLGKVRYMPCCIALAEAGGIDG